MFAEDSCGGFHADKPEHFLDIIPVSGSERRFDNSFVGQVSRVAGPPDKIRAIRNEVLEAHGFILAKKQLFGNENLRNNFLIVVTYVKKCSVFSLHSSAWRGRLLGYGASIAITIR